MKLTTAAVLLCVSLIVCGCAAREDAGSTRPPAQIESVSSSLAPASCTKETDPNDPNGTTYLACPGTSGYRLIVRRVDAGRRSIDIVDQSGKASPLDYQEFVTRHMCTLGETAEWRVTKDSDGRQIPIALIVPVLAHEDDENPEKVTRTYLAVAKISRQETCVTGTIPEGSKPEAAVLRAADAARSSACAPPLPPITEGGVVIR